MYYLFDNINNYNDNDYKSFYNRLNKSDRIKIDKLINNNDKKLTILSRMLLDRLLNKYYYISYFDINIKYNKYNKPYTDNICFNISHSNDYACAVVSDKNVGIDIEFIREVDINTIKYYCNTKEIDFILNSKNKYKSLFQIYCLKEACVKMLGTGIRDLKNVNYNNYNYKLDYSIDNYVIAIIEEKD